VFQLSYFLFVLLVGGVTGCLLGLSNPDIAATRARAIMLVVSAGVLLAFFTSFGFFWGAITVAELVVGVLIGIRITTPKDEVRGDEQRATSKPRANGGAFCLRERRAPTSATAPSRFW
jgi:hypothetical protein